MINNQVRLMIFSPNKYFWSFSNKQNLDEKKKKKIGSTDHNFGMLAETQVISFRLYHIN